MVINEAHYKFRVALALLKALTQDGIASFFEASRLPIRNISRKINLLE